MPRDTSFYYSFLALPALERDAIISVWDFCRAVDDAVDEVGGASTACPEPGRGDPLARWRRELASCFGGGAPETEQGRRLEPHVSRFQLPRQPFEDLIDGVEMDLHRRRYETFELLHQYCLRVASAVGLICLPIFGARHTRSREYATYLGVALQLTNIIRDVSSDLARGRLYLPLEDLHRFGCTEGEGAGVLPAGQSELAARGRAPAGRGPHHGRDLLRPAAPHRARGLRCVLGCDSGAAEASRLDRGQGLGGDDDENLLIG
ncbi:MAG: squalene/phytoene synthase family protein [Acidobacteria bacterium]|nr:squalene/phytoene synthase family protein [Acidobacteriota bacterium]